MNDHSVRCKEQQHQLKRYSSNCSLVVQQGLESFQLFNFKKIAFSEKIYSAGDLTICLQKKKNLFSYFLVDFEMGANIPQCHTFPEGAPSFYCTLQLLPFAE